MGKQLSPDLISLMLSLFIFLLLVFFVVIAIAVRYRKRKRENEQMRIAFSEQLLKSQLEIQHQTLQQVSREIHDNLGQVASLIKINLNTVQLQNREASELKLENTRELVRTLITDLKLLSSSLNTDRIGKTGLLGALRSEVERLNKTGVFSATLTEHDHIPAINNEKSIIIYRMCQEILNNAIKHSQAKEINIDAWYEKNTFILKLTDNGSGFNVAEKMADIHNTGNGLLNLQNRAKVIHASVGFKSEKDKGTETTIEMPLNNT
ncbi:MAG: sensor histidine kinase [Ferruginibacter sp.]|nr:sensor histidine kinase [Ferruginibacter sp.]